MMCAKDNEAAAMSDDVDVLIDRFVDSSLSDEVHGEAFEALSELISSGCNDGTMILFKIHSISNTSYVIIKAHLGHNLISSHYMIGYRITSSSWCSIMCNYSRSGWQDGETGICKLFHVI